MDSSKVGENGQALRGERRRLRGALKSRFPRGEAKARWQDNGENKNKAQKGAPEAKNAGDDKEEDDEQEDDSSKKPKSKGKPASKAKPESKGAAKGGKTGNAKGGQGSGKGKNEDGLAGAAAAAHEKKKGEKGDDDNDDEEKDDEEDEEEEKEDSKAKAGDKRKKAAPKSEDKESKTATRQQPSRGKKVHEAARNCHPVLTMPSYYRRTSHQQRSRRMTRSPLLKALRSPSPAAVVLLAQPKVELARIRPRTNDQMVSLVPLLPSTSRSRLKARLISRRARASKASAQANRAHNICDSSTPQRAIHPVYP